MLNRPMNYFMSAVLGMLTLPGVTLAQSGIWVNAAGGSWANSANWDAGTIATGSDSTADFSTLTLTAARTNTLDGAQTIGNLTFGDIGNAYGWTLNASTTNASLPAANVLTLSVSSGSPTITVNGQTNSIGLILTGVNGLTKAGGGTLTLSGSNTFSGGTLISAGQARAGNNKAFGLGPVTVNSLAEIAAAGSPRILANVITNFGGTVRNVNTNSIFTITNGVVLAADGFFSLRYHDATAFIEITNTRITGTNGFTLIDENNVGGTAGSPVLRLSIGGNTYSGNTTIASGTLRMNAASALPSGTGKGNVILDGGTNLAGTLDLFGFNTSINGLSGTNNTVLGVVTNSSATTATLTVGNYNVSSTFSGVLKGKVGLIKAGTGALTLTATNSYTGVTSIGAGRLVLNGGSITSTPSISIGGNAVFDVSASPFALGGSQTLGNNNNAVTGIINGSVTTGSGTVTVYYDFITDTPALAITNGTFTLASTTHFNVNNTDLSTLSPGSYKLITTNLHGTVSGPLPATVSVTGTGLDPGASASLQITNGELFLVVAGASTASTNAFLNSLVLTPAGALAPAFATNLFGYAATNAFGGTPTVTVVCPSYQIVRLI